MRTASRLPRLARILEKYLRLFDPDATQIEFLERSRLKGQRLKQLRSELDRLKARRGSTLTEVLVALMIMSIGLVSILSLFVLATVKSTEAAKMTRGTDLRHNAEGMLAVYPWIIHNPDQAKDPAVHFNENFVFDPLGYAVLGAQAPALAATFGNDGSGNPTGILKRYRGTWTTEALAETLVASPDSWDLQVEGFGSNGTATQIDVPGLAPFTLPARPACRVLIFNQDQTAAQTRTPTGIVGNTVKWSEALPAGFVAGNVRVELQDRRYTWLFTVRQNSIGISTADLVVFFNRALSPQDELLRPATFTAGKSVNGAFVPGKITITGPAAAIRKGSFIFDADNCWWYQTQNASDNGDGTCNVVTEFPPAFDSPAAGGHVMQMAGIIGVFHGEPF